LQGLDVKDQKTVTCAIGSVCSKEITSQVAELVSDCLGIAPWIIENTSKMPFMSKYANGQAGIDRLANVAGAGALGKVPAIVVDAGTAITLEVIDSDGTFLGGSIFPGPWLVAQSLSQKANQLPLTEPEVPSMSVATTTAEAIQSGLTFGIAGAIDRLIQNAMVEYFPGEAEQNFHEILMTGGHAQLYAPLLYHRSEILPDLTLIGLRAIFLAQ
jgi:type III pantothenate kinase